MVKKKSFLFFFFLFGRVNGGMEGQGMYFTVLLKNIYICQFSMILEFLSIKTPVWHMETLKMVTYLFLLPTAAPVRLVQKPGAEDWIHIDGYALHTDEKDSSWMSWKHKYKACVRPGIFNMSVQDLIVAKGPQLKLKDLSQSHFTSFSQRFVQITCLFRRSKQQSLFQFYCSVWYDTKPRITFSFDKFLWNLRLSLGLGLLLNNNLYQQWAGPEVMH